MASSFSAIIYKTGINLCVDVPPKVSAGMKAIKGYIPIKGTINGHAFTQTLVPVKNGAYRLFVNGPMLKATGAGIHDKVQFIIEQDESGRQEPIPGAFKKALSKHKLKNVFEQLTPGRRKEVLRYLNNLKTKESLERNIIKVIDQLHGKSGKPGGERKGFLRNLEKRPEAK